MQKEEDNIKISDSEGHVGEATAAQSVSGLIAKLASQQMSAGEQGDAEQRMTESPLYAQEENGRSVESIMAGVRSGEEYLMPTSLYNDVINSSESASERMIDWKNPPNWPSLSKYESEIVKPNLTDNVETPVAPLPEPQHSKEPEPQSQQMLPKQKDRVTRLDEGIATAINQVGLSWKYLLKNVELNFTQDEERQEELRQDINRISEEYASLPEMSGMAQVGSVGMNVVGVALPTIMSGLFMSPVGAAAVGGTLAGIDMAGTAAQANMEMDAYEKSEGVKVSDADRAAYTTASVATDLVMNVLLGSSVIDGASRVVRKGISQELKKSIMKNPVAQQEFNTMTQQVMKNERKAWQNGAKEVIKRSAIQSGVEGAATSGALEAEKSIYTHDAPELGRVVNSVLTGFATGMAQGAVAGYSTPQLTHQRRMAEDDIYYVSNMRNRPEGGLPISEIDISGQKDIKGKSYVEGEVSNSVSGQTEEGLYKADNVAVGSYREAHKAGATHDNTDKWNITPEKVAEYEKEWSDSLFAPTEEEYYNQRNEIVQKMAADMGVPVTVYAKVEDLPQTLQHNKTIYESSGITLENDKIIVVLDICDRLDADELVKTMYHESVGHFGMPKLYRSRREFNEEMDRVGSKVYPKDDKKRVPQGDEQEKITNEEYMAMDAENREEYQNGDPDSKYAEVYDILRRSEATLRNSTINELRHSNVIRALDNKVLKGGKPMPSLYELEQRRARQ